MAAFISCLRILTGCFSRTGYVRLRGAQASRALSRRFLRGAALPLIFTAFLIGATTAAAQEPTQESQVVAAFLLNFTRFVTWPADAFESDKAPLVICIAGTDPFGQFIDRLVADETAEGRTIAIKRTPLQTPAPTACQLLFTHDTGAETAKVLAESGHGVLTVTEGNGKNTEKGMIHLFLENNRVRFDVNQKTAESAGLKISSKLLSVARSVK